ncbi:hypothetical protein M426DRAFT_322210 [Hypoxylon sp. CI-4A]|nr:hypothetical protein M426DRAFT_322210 [Hypoxylon sp. CI-4A]
MAPVLLDLIGQYPVLKTLASYVSTVDLFHLSLTCRDYHAYIQPSSKVFEALRRDCLCDGHGMRQRQKHFDDLRPTRAWHKWRRGGPMQWDDEIEVRFLATKCDEAGALPCLKCGINLCEECRVCPRVMPKPGYPNRRPHLNGPWQNENLMCLCDACDAKQEDQVRGKFLNELCDCDYYRRWICMKCAKEEKKWTDEYYKNNTIPETHQYERYEELYDFTKVMMDHQFEILFLCICGAFVPKEARPRCTLCKRRHRPESEWADEMKETRKIPFDDGSYPVFVPDATSYPTLAYNGPIYQGPFRNDDSG